MNKFRQAPLEVKAFFIFCNLVTLIGYLLPLISKETYKKIIPFTGSSMAITYSFILIALFFNIFKKSKITIISLKILIVTLFSLHMYHGYQAMTIGNGEDFDNPYLIVSEYRYIWVFVIPIAWILVFLLSPNLKFRESK